MFSSLLLSRLRHVDEFSPGAKGRGAGTSPEHAAAHPRSEATTRGGKEKQFMIYFCFISKKQGGEMFPKTFGK